MPGTMTTFPCNGENASRYLAVPAEGKGPGVVVIQEWWGLVPHIKSVADRFAAAGFLALAPDLYHGKSTRSPDEAGKLMMAMNIDRAERDLAGAVSFLKNHPANSARKAGTVGFCMGGALSLYAATKNKDVSACVVFYGGHPNVHPELANLAAPVLGIYGEKDGSVTVEAIRALERKLKSLAKVHEIHVYPNCGHAFFNDERPEVYNREAASDAWKRTVEFLRKNLTT